MENEKTNINCKYSSSLSDEMVKSKLENMEDTLTTVLEYKEVIADLEHNISTSERGYTHVIDLFIDLIYFARKRHIENDNHKPIIDVLIPKYIMKPDIDDKQIDEAVSGLIKCGVDIEPLYGNDNTIKAYYITYDIDKVKLTKMGEI